MWFISCNEIMSAAYAAQSVDSGFAGSPPQPWHLMSCWRWCVLVTLCDGKPGLWAKLWLGQRYGWRGANRRHYLPTLQGTTRYQCECWRRKGLIADCPLPVDGGPGWFVKLFSSAMIRAHRSSLILDVQTSISAWLTNFVMLHFKLLAGYFHDLRSIDRSKRQAFRVTLSLQPSYGELCPLTSCQCTRLNK